MLLAAVFGVGTIAPHNASAVSLINGQKHYYSVQLRSDKQAIVYGKVIFSAEKSEEKSRLTLRIPEGVNVSNLTAQQLLAKSQPGQCKTYETYNEWLQRQSGEQTTTRSSSSSVSADSYERTKRCLDYTGEGSYNEDYDYDTNTISSNDYYSPYYYIDRDSSFDYEDIKITQNGQSLQFELPRAIKPEKQGAFLLSFTTSDYVDGALGYYNYSFRTLIADSLIESTSVGIDFDDDLYSSQATQKRSTEMGTTSQSSSDQSIREGVSSAKSVNETQQNVGKGGRYIKTQGKMLPGDTFEVRGTFATNPILLMGKQIGILIVMLLAGVLLYLWYRRYRKSHPKSAPAVVSTNTGDSEQRLADTRTRTSWLPQPPATDGLVTLPEMIKVSLVSIFATIFGVWVVTILLMDGQMYNASGITGVLSAVLLVAAVLTIALFGLIIIPGLNILRYGVKQAYAWSLVHFVTLLIIIFVLASLLSVLAGGQSSEEYYIN